MSAKQRTEGELSWESQLAQAKHGVEVLLHAALDAEEEYRAAIKQVAPLMRDSAANLTHYLAVRRHDVRALQDQLARIGLSSLGRMEAHVMASLKAVLRVLHTLMSEPFPADVRDDPPVTFDTGAALLAEHTKAILGPAPQGRQTRIMVTMPGEAADDPGLIRAMVEAGMEIMRINCAHDSRAIWERIVKHLRQAERELGKRCLVSCDVAGPKLRTGPVAPGPAVIRWRPTRNAMGEVTQLARVRLTAGNLQAEANGQTIPVEPALLDKAQPGDTFTFVDARKRKRVLRVREVREGECVCETDRSAYVVPGTRLTLRRNKSSIAEGEVGSLPAIEQAIALAVGDTLEVSLGDTPGRNAVRDAEGRITESACISCALPEVFSGVRVGEPILFDDGKFRGMISGVGDGRFKVEITATAGGKLRSEKGINLPESYLALPALTSKDIEDLAFVAEHADMVAMSFVQHPDDIDDLLRELAKLNASQLGIVLKIETKVAFTRLPDLLLRAMRHPRLAVMIARGDLGVETGFERLSEIQEEILWLCEAAHIPGIWATQVLESLAKGGMPTRAEVSDAAMSGSAECVMLNKGPYILETLEFLKNVLERIAEHRNKKSSRLRKLRVASPAKVHTSDG